MSQFGGVIHQEMQVGHVTTGDPSVAITVDVMVVHMKIEINSLDS